MDRHRSSREPPTFAQTVVIIQTMPRTERDDVEAIKLRHLALGFSYDNSQIHRALRALTDPARRHRNN